MRKLFVPLLAMGMVVFADVSYAAFGSSRSSSGVSRSYSRPATSSYSKPATTYKAPSYSTSSQSPRSSSSDSYKSNYNSGYSNNNYRSNSYNDAPRQSSTMRDIGVTAAGVGGGILAASAITALVSSPGHAGMYTHPQYPGQYFNQQGQPVQAPAPQRQATQEQYMPEQYTVQQYSQPQPYQQPVVVVQPKEEGFSFFGMLWGFLWFVIKLAFFLSVVGAIGYGIYKLVKLARNKEVRDQVQATVQAKVQEKFDFAGKFADLDNKAMDIFYEFQKNSDNESWVRANTKYLPVKECLSAPSEVLEFEHRTTDCVIEQGKIRGTVLYRAVLNDGTGEVNVHQYWNFENDAGTWKLIGFEAA
ncbi:hypothetical protein [Pseudomonas sp. P8_250]|uniref:hypothetical protein n=1 Tax=Pseudomonas sp. P8_250 TaxID=3043446 RepID=UPI002A365B66|nr:hypothetical protein [Pseudomonas sp. P8_250]MDX9668675.1 hypothetical protein [Pseudomonas sp. P8_250]